MQSLNEILFRPLNDLIFQSDVFDAVVLFGAEELWLWMTVALLIPIVIFLFQKYWWRRGMLAAAERWRSSAQFACVALVSAAVAVVIGKIIKETFVSPRPFLALPDVNLLFEHGDVDSFPSGHTTFTFALAVAVYLYRHRLGVLYILLALVVALSRVIAGVHWPFDILAGALLGTAVAWAIFHLIKKWNDTKLPN